MNHKTYPTLIFNEDDTFTINSGCNVIGGTYTLAENEIPTEILNITLIACEETLTTNETHLLRFFPTTL